jgi:hypothetical protein
MSSVGSNTPHEAVQAIKAEQNTAFETDHPRSCCETHAIFAVGQFMPLQRTMMVMVNVMVVKT